MLVYILLVYVRPVERKKMVGRTGKRRPKVDRFKTKVILFFKTKVFLFFKTKVFLFFMLGVDEH